MDSSSLPALISEFRYASIYDENHQTRREGIDDMVGPANRTPSNLSSLRAQLCPATGVFFKNGRPDCLSRTDQCRHKRCSKNPNAPASLHMTSGLSPKSFEPCHTLPPPPPPPPPPSPTTKECHEESWQNHLSERTHGPQDGLGPPFLHYEFTDPAETHVRDDDHRDEKRPDSPWSADSGIEISPPRPLEPRSKPVKSSEREMASGRSSDSLEMEVGLGMDEGVGIVVDGDRTWTSMFGSPLGLDIKRDEGAESPIGSEFDAGGDIIVEVEEWCPGGAGCDHYGQPSMIPERAFGWVPLTPPAESTRMMESYEQYASGLTVGITLPDDIIEPSSPSLPLSLQSPPLQRSEFSEFDPSELYPSFGYRHFEMPNACMPYPAGPILYAAHHLNGGPNPQPLSPFPLNLTAPILLHSPGLSSRSVSFGQFLYLQNHYSYADPMLGRKGAWKCSLCKCGSREPPDFVRSGPWENPVEISELGAPTNRVALSRLGFDVDLKKRERLAERRHAETHRGHGSLRVRRGRERSFEKRINPSHTSLGPKRIAHNKDIQETASEKLTATIGEQFNDRDKAKGHTRRHSYQDYLPFRPLPSGEGQDR